MLADLQKKVVGLLTENASAILTAGGVVGTVTTAVLTGRAAVKAHEVIRTAEMRESIDESNRADHAINIEFSLPRKTLLVWPLYIPPVLAGGATVGSIVLANRMSAQKAAALAAAYGLSERQLREYKEKVAQKLSPNKQQQIHDEIAQDRVNTTPNTQQIVVLEGEVLCFDQPTGRYFRSSMEKINRAVNATNAEILQNGYADASFFYEELGLAPTTWTNDVGWNNTDSTLVDLTISTVLSADERPCIAIDFKYLPKPDFMSDYS